MQALESLNDNQVNDFLSGKTPLNLSMRLGDHMMLIQLQLSTVTPTTAASAAAAAASPANSSSGDFATSSFAASTAKSASTNSIGFPASSSSSPVALPSVRTSSSHLRQSLKSRISSSDNHHHYNHNHHNNQQQQQHPHHPSVASTTTATQSTSPLYRAGTATTSTSSNNCSSQSANNCTDGPHSTSLGTSARTSHRYHPHQRSSLPPRPSADSNGSVLLLQTPGRNSTSAPKTPVGAAPALEQSPITSLSNLVSSPMQTTAPSTTTTTQQQPNAPMIVDTTKFTPPCICRRLNAVGAGLTGDNPRDEPTHHCSVPLPPFEPVPGFRSGQLHSHSLLQAQHNRTSNNPIGRRRHGTVLSPATAAMVAASEAADLRQSLRRTKSSDNIRLAAHNGSSPSNTHHHNHRHLHQHHHHQSAATSSSAEAIDHLMNTSSTATLAEASRSLTQTLRKLSKEVFTNKPLSSGGGSGAGSSNQTISTTSPSQSSSSSSSVHRKSSSSSDSQAVGNGASSSVLSASMTGTGTAVASGSSSSTSSSSSTTSSAVLSSGAVIESMKNHGKGIYSGTFSGTLNPALQDRNGRPKRDISTVIHILNDLLSATPHYTRGARICFEPTTTATTSAVSGSPMAASSSSRSIKQV